TEIQNWAIRIGFTFGSTWRMRSRTGGDPEARACSTNSEFRTSRTVAATMRADAAQPNAPSRANVTMTDVTAGISNGNNARTVTSRASADLHASCPKPG